MSRASQRAELFARAAEWLRSRLSRTSRFQGPGGAGSQSGGGGVLEAPSEPRDVVAETDRVVLARVRERELRRRAWAAGLGSGDMSRERRD